jgi:hypothetical protein
MHELLKNPKKRRQLLIAGVAAGGLLLFLLLRKRSSSEAVTETGASPAVEQVPVEASGGGAEGAGGTGGGLGSQGQAELGAFLQGLQQQQQASAQQQQQFSTQQQQQQEAFANYLAQLSASHSAAPAATPEGEAAAASRTAAGVPQREKAAGTPLSQLNNEKGNPREGQRFTPGSYHGKEAHIYARPVPGGVGPHHNVVVLPPKRTPSVPPAAVHVNTEAGSPRKGLDFTEGRYKGKRAHIYSHAVSGGVGAKHNIIVL